jgi:hypothetical protein
MSGLFGGEPESPLLRIPLDWKCRTDRNSLRSAASSISAGDWRSAHVARSIPFVDGFFEANRSTAVPEVLAARAMVALAGFGDVDGLGFVL